MKTIKTLIILFFLFTAFTQQAQLMSEIEGELRISDDRARLELFDSSNDEERVEGWLEEAGDKIYLSSFYSDLIFSSDTTGAEIERMRINGGNGFVGIGTSGAQSKLHVNGDFRTEDGDVIVGDGLLYLTDGIQDVHMGNLGGAFFLSANGPASPHQLYIQDGTGYVGINTSNVLTSLHVKQVGLGKGIRMEDHADSDYWETYIDNLNDYNFGFNGVLRAYIQQSTGAYVQTSDRRLKNSIDQIDSVLDKLIRLKPSQYYYNIDRNAIRKAWGFVAQEVEEIFPELVLDKDGYKGLVYDDFAIMSVKAIQEQQVLINQQQDLIQQLEKRLTALENK